jgi:hypothetical protein
MHEKGERRRGGAGADEHERGIYRLHRVLGSQKDICALDTRHVAPMEVAACVQARRRYSKGRDRGGRRFVFDQRLQPTGVIGDGPLHN